MKVRTTMAFLIPTFSEKENAWVVEVDGRVEKGDLMWVVAEFIHNALIYPYKSNGQNDHEHEFEGFLYTLLGNPVKTITPNPL